MTPEEGQSDRIANRKGHLDGCDDGAVTLDQAESGALGVQTFLIADIRGYTRYTAEHGDEAAAALASRFADIVARVVGERDGRLVELRGDEALVAFASARQAIRAAVELQIETQELPRGIGIGLDAGEAVPVAEGYRGGALNLAARLCSLAGPGEILASETVIQLARTVDGIRYGDRRTERVKGIAKPVTAIEVLGPQGTGHTRRRARRLWRRRGVRIAVLVGPAVLAAVAAVLVLGARSTPSGAGSGVRMLPNSLASYDPATHRVLSDTRLRSTPGPIAIGSGRAWALSRYGRVLTSAARSGDAHSFRLHGSASGHWAGAGTASTANDFLALQGSNQLTEITQAIGGDAGAALRADSPIKLWHASPTDAECTPNVTGTGSVVWFSRGRRLAEIDGTTGLVRQTHTLPLATNAPRSVTCYAVNYSGGHLLAARSPDDSIGTVDPAAGTFHAITTGISGVMPPAGSNATVTWTATPDALWIARNGALLGLDLKTGKTLAHLPLGAGARLATSSTDAVWALGDGGHQLLRVDPATGQIAARIPLPAKARDIATGLGRVWVTIGSA
jgi:class 3 adenylate cyclase